MNSIMETINRGKSVTVVPTFGDQIRTGLMYDQHDLGNRLTIPDLAVNGKFISELDQAINNQSYARKAKRLSEMIGKKPNLAKEQLIKHIEFVAEFSQIANFDSYCWKMSFVSYYMIDIIILFAILLLLIITIIFYVIIRIFKKLFDKAFSYKSHGSVVIKDLKNMKLL